MRDIWSFLISQLLLPTCVAFFFIQKNQWMGGKKMLSFPSCILQHTMLHKLSLSFRKEQNSPSVPWINSTITEDPCSVYSTVLLNPVCESHTCWCEDFSEFVFLWEYLFCRAGNGPHHGTCLVEGALRNVPYLLSYCVSLDLHIILVSRLFSPCTNVRWLG